MTENDAKLIEAIILSPHEYRPDGKSNGVEINYIVHYFQYHFDKQITESMVRKMIDESQEITHYEQQFCDNPVYNTKEPLYYKYRSIATKEQLGWFIDSIKNNQLHASHFQDLNDPMEGTFWNINEMFSSVELEKIRSEKNKNYICSLCKEINNILMWAHYADSCEGVAIGVEVKDTQQQEIREIDYSSPMIYPKKKEECEVVAVQVLSCKLPQWSYEKEVRVFSDKDSVDVIIKAVILGQKMPKIYKGVLKQLINSINPDIIVLDNFVCDTFEAK